MADVHIQLPFCSPKLLYIVLSSCLSFDSHVLFSEKDNYFLTGLEDGKEASATTLSGTFWSRKHYSSFIQATLVHIIFHSDYKVLLMKFKVLNGLDLLYLADVLNQHVVQLRQACR